MLLSEQQQSEIIALESIFENDFQSKLERKKLKIACFCNRNHSIGKTILEKLENQDEIEISLSSTNLQFVLRVKLGSGYPENNPPESVELCKKNADPSSISDKLLDDMNRKLRFYVGFFKKISRIPILPRAPSPPPPPPFIDY